MKRMLTVLLVLGVMSAVSMAAVTLTYDLRYETTYNSSNTSIGDKSATFNGGISAGYDPTWSNRFGLYVSVSGLASGEDLNQLSFGFGFTGGCSMYNTTFTGSTTSVNVQTGVDDDNNPTFQTLPIFSSVSDSGTPGDLRGWLATINAGPAFVSQFGENTTYNKVGTIRCKWDGVTNNSEFQVFGDPPGGSTFVTWVNNNGFPYSTTIDASVRTAVGDSQLFTTVPEPATMGLLALGGLLLRRRR